MAISYEGRLINLANKAKYLKSDNDNLSFVLFNDSYFNLLDDLNSEDDVDNDTYAVMVRYAVTVCMSMRERDTFMIVPRSEMLLDLLVKDTNLSLFLEQPDSDDALAWFCLGFSVKFVYEDVPNDFTESFLGLLSKWTKTSLNEEVFERMPGPDVIVELLYGKGCWELSNGHLDADSPREQLFEALSEIASLNIPYAFKRNTEARLEVTGSLPGNIL